MTAPTLQERLSAQPAIVGILQTHPSLAVAEMAAMCGYDFVLLDVEHGLFSELDLVHAIQVIGNTGALPMIRVGNHDPRPLGRYLDIGARVLVVPHVSTADQARALARGMEYAPKGTRGFGASLHRGTRYGQALEAHLSAPRQGASLLVMFESVAGSHNAPEILAVEGVDGAIIGPWDLTADLGRATDFSQPGCAEAMARIEKAAAERGAYLGTAPYPGSPIEVLISRGHRIFIIDDDMSMLCDTMTARVAQAKAALKSGAKRSP